MHKSVRNSRICKFRYIAPNTEHFSAKFLESFLPERIFNANTYFSKLQIIYKHAKLSKMNKKPVQKVDFWCDAWSSPKILKLLNKIIIWSFAISRWMKHQVSQDITKTNFSFFFISLFHRRIACISSVLHIFWYFFKIWTL